MAAIAGLSGLEASYMSCGPCYASAWLSEFVKQFRTRVVEPPLAVVFQEIVVQPTQFASAIHYTTDVCSSERIL